MSAKMEESVTASAGTSTQTIRDDSALYEIVRLRYWHHVLNEMLKKKLFKIPIHLAFGHEAAAVAMDRVMRPDDRLCLSHRNVAYNLARAKSLQTVLDHYHLVERATPCALMGSMNLATERTSIAYSSSILGNDLAVGAGIAMNRVISKRPGVIFVNTGDGAMEEGVFWETLIFSRSRELPLVVVVENNDFSMSSTISERRTSIDLSHVCKGVGYRYFSASGAVFGEAKRAIESARESAESGLPGLVELEISTFCQHAGPTPGWPTDPLNISLDNGLLLEEAADDPLYNIRSEIGVDAFDRLWKRVIEESGDE